MLNVRARRRQVRELAKEELLRELSRLDGEDKRVLVEILVHLSEVDRRKLHVERGSSSLFDYCTRQMGWSESAAGRRIAVARAMERFPVIADMLLAGEVNLSTVAQVARLLSEENHENLLGRIRGRSRREVEAIVAELRPRQATRDRVRPLGRPRGAGADPAATPNRGGGGTPGSVGPLPGAAETPLLSPRVYGGEGSPPEAGPTPHSTRSVDQPAQAASSEASSPAQTRSTPAGGSGCGGSPAEALFEIRFCAGAGFLRDFERAKELLSGKHPQGMSYEEVFATVLAEFLARKDPVLRAQRRRTRAGGGAGQRREPALARTGTAADGDGVAANATRPQERLSVEGRPQQSKEAERASRMGPQVPSRAVPRKLRDAVHLRDGGQCTFISPGGVRCQSRWDLELDHIVPFCRGGPHSLENLRLRCAAHNQYEARQQLGAELMATRAPHRS